jgi:protein-tyrosine phosphatase
MDRVVDLAGSVNFRDFGGYATADGRRVRRGLLFRCGQMASLTEAAQSQFAELNIDAICDLRRPDEREADPTPVPDHVSRRVEIPIDPASASMLSESLADRTANVEQRVAFMQAITEGLARDHAWGYALMFQTVQNHAPAGKDRTGVGVALIQLALGVPRESIMEDYLLTNEVIDFEGFLLPRLRANLGDDSIDVESAKVLSGVCREYLQGSLDEMQRACGSVEGYLEQAIGLSPRAHDTLRDQFLE